MSADVVQVAPTGNPSATFATVPATTHQVIAVATTYGNSGTPVPTVSGLGGTWTLIASIGDINNFVRMGVYRCTNPDGVSATVTVAGSGVNGKQVFAWEISGAATATPTVTTAGNSSNGSSYTTSSIAATDPTNDLLLMALGVNGGTFASRSFSAYTWTVDSSLSTTQIDASHCRATATTAATESVIFSSGFRYCNVAIRVAATPPLPPTVLKPEASTSLYSDTTFTTMAQVEADTSLLSNTGFNPSTAPAGSTSLLSNTGAPPVSSAAADTHLLSNTGAGNPPAPEVSTELYSNTAGSLPVAAGGSTYLYSDTLPASVPGAEASTWLYSDTTVVTVDVAEVSVEVARTSGTAAGQLAELDTVVLRAPEIPAGQVAELDTAALRAPLVASGQAAAVWVTVIRPPAPPVDLDLAVFSAAVRAEADVRSRVHDLGGP